MSAAIYSFAAAKRAQARKRRQPSAAEVRRWQIANKVRA